MAADQLHINWPTTGATLYAHILDDSAAIWNGSSLVTFVVANYATYTITVTESPASSCHYKGTVPALSAGWYIARMRLRVGGSAAVTDPVVGQDLIYWTGTAIDRNANVGRWLGTTVSTPTVAGVPNVNVKTWNDLTTVALPLVPTVAGRSLDVSAGGEAGVDWANVGTPGSTVNLSATTVNLCNTITTYTGNTVQTGDSFARIGANGVGLTSVALADTTSDAVIADAVWNAATATYGSAGSYGLLIETDLDATISSRLASASYTAPSNLTAAQIATGVWQDATAGDFTAASSIGKALYVANVAPGGAGGHFIAGTNAATSITTALTANIVGNITGNLSGSVGSLTANNDKTGYSIADVTSDAVIADAVWNAATASYGSAGTYGLLIETDLDATISSRLATAGYTAPTNLTAAQIATGVWTDTTAGDFTVALSVGKSIMNGVTLGTGLTVAAIGTGGITTGSFASGAIDAAAIATNAIGSSELAASAGTEIATAVRAELTTELARIDAAITSRSTLTQTEVTGGAYALNSASFAFNAALDFTTTQKAATLARVTLTDTATTVTNRVTANADQIAGSAAAATGISAMGRTIATGTVQTDAGNSTTSFKIDPTLGAKVANYFGNSAGGLVLHFLAGAANEYIGQRVASFDTSTDIITVSDPFPAIPTDGDSFALIGHIET